jgi:hypothetical protein
LFAALAAASVVAVGSAGPAAAVQGQNTKYATITKDCTNSITGQKEGEITYTGPVEVWPPNHKYVSATITVTDDDAEPATDQATASVVGRHDQMVDDTTEMTGSGNTDPATDVVPGAGSGNPTASTTIKFRAERSGHGSRTYTFTVDGTTDNGTSTCNPVTFTAVVPHDQGQGAGGPAMATKLALRLNRAR